MNWEEDLHELEFVFEQVILFMKLKVFLESNKNIRTFFFVDISGISLSMLEDLMLRGSR
jgi:hypothetical protein